MGRAANDPKSDYERAAAQSGCGAPRAGEHFDLGATGARAERFFRAAFKVGPRDKICRSPLLV